MLAADTRTSRESDASFSLSPPEVLNLRTISDPLKRNNAINTWYHQIDELLTVYVGNPPLPNWATFAKHASHSVGTELCTLKEVALAIESAHKVFDDVKALSWRRLR